MPSRLAFQAQSRVADNDVQGAAMRSSLDRFVTPCASPFLETKKHRADKRHQRALAGFVRTIEHVQSRIQRSPVLIVPDSETVNLDMFNFHRVHWRSQIRRFCILDLK